MKFLLMGLKLSDRCFPACCYLVRMWSTAHRMGGMLLDMRINLLLVKYIIKKKRSKAGKLFPLNAKEKPVRILGKKIKRLINCN